MKTSLVAVGPKMPGWVVEAYRDYEKRLPKELKPQLKELALAQRSKKSNSEKIKQDEGRAILQLLPENEFVVALEVKGASWSTENLAHHLDRWRMEGHNVSFVIGGPDGLSQECLQRANCLWSLSALTLPHPLVRVIFIEQLYRAWSLLQNHPYHK